ncbi:MAG: alpha/beta fold hydrolase [Actinomycetes bacterium]
MAVHVEVAGTGERVLLVHGGIMPARMMWSEQRPLASRWRLELLDRRGFGKSPPRDAEDFDEDADDLIGVIGDEPVHLVGMSYGGVASVVAAARRPPLRSLTLIEPPLFSVARHDAHANALREELDRLTADFDSSDVRGWLERFLPAIGSAFPLPDPLPEWLDRSARLLHGARQPWEAEPDLDAVRDTGVPVLVVTGGHSAGFEAIADALTDRLGAHRATVPGLGHGVPRTGAPFNDVLEDHLRRSSRT